MLLHLLPSVGMIILMLLTAYHNVGYIIKKECNDKRNIFNRRSRFISQVNNLICVSGKLDCMTKMRLFKDFCISFYGCELWDLSSDCILTLCKTWRNCT